MSIPTIIPSLSAGELSPSLYGRVDLAKWRAGLSVARNVFVNYKGGAISRAGTKFVGVALQGASFPPPRLIKFQFSTSQSYELEFGQGYMRVIANGGYVTQAPKIISGVSLSNPCTISAPGHGFNLGDSVAIDGVGGTVQVNGRTFRVVNPTLNTFDITDPFNVPVDSRFFGVYTGGGTASRIFTLATPYAAVDLPYLKFTQSADVMSLTCVNQQSGVDYPPQELTRLSASSWTIAPASFASAIAAPGSMTASPSNAAAGVIEYRYCATAVSASGEESQASPVAIVTTSVNMASTAGSMGLSCAPVANAVSYNFYRAPVALNGATVPVGVLFGYIGTSTSVAFVDDNIIPDFALTPPLHQNPFPSTGNYPGVVAYFQQRRAYAQTLNAPDTYFLSQTGAYKNMDSAIPPVASDAVIGTPWAQQINGIQWMLPMPGGLIIGTGLDAWQLSGSAGAGSAVGPASQNAQPQEANGFSPILPPLKINYDILYGQALGSSIRDIQYNFVTNIYAGTDITVLSSHLFMNHVIMQWAWSPEPWKVVWALRDDGKLLSLTYVKEQEVSGWTRHDTNGIVVSVSSASEPPVEAIYLVVKRYVIGAATWAYFVERMDPRLWQSVEQVWAVDCGLSLPLTLPSATLTASAAQGSGAISGGTVVYGGAGYTAPVGRVIDLANKGSGAIVTAISVVGGVITGVTVAGGNNYVAPQLVIEDPHGSGAVVTLGIDQAVTFTSSAAVFNPATDIGRVIRMGGGIATITNVTSTLQVVASVTTPIVQTIGNDPSNTPVPATQGLWSIATPVSAVTNLWHLEGMTVTGLADGSVIPPTVVANGTVALPSPASAVVVGLPFTAQGQSMHAEIQGEQIQGKRKRIAGLTVRMANSRGIKVGQDQPIAAVQPFQAELPWNQAPNFMTEMQDRRNSVLAGNAVPLFTGDYYFQIAGDYNTVDGQPSPGMVAVQQDYPLPMEILAFIPELDIGDLPNG